MNTCPGLDTAVYPCWIPRETRHGTREKHIIRGVHLREPVRCYWRKTSRGTHLRLCFWLILLLAGNFFFFFFFLSQSPGFERLGSGHFFSSTAAPDPGEDTAGWSGWSGWSPPRASYYLSWSCSAVRRRQTVSSSPSRFCTCVPVWRDETLGRPDRTGWMLFKLGSNQFTYK